MPGRSAGRRAAQRGVVRGLARCCQAGVEHAEVAERDGAAVRDRMLVGREDVGVSLRFAQRRAELDYLVSAAGTERDLSGHSASPTECNSPMHKSLPDGRLRTGKNRFRKPAPQRASEIRPLACASICSHVLRLVTTGLFSVKSFIGGTPPFSGPTVSVEKRTCGAGAPGAGAAAASCTCRTMTDKKAHADTSD